MSHTCEKGDGQVLLYKLDLSSSVQPLLGWTLQPFSMVKLPVHMPGTAPQLFPAESHSRDPHSRSETSQLGIVVLPQSILGSQLHPVPPRACWTVCTSLGSWRVNELLEQGMASIRSSGLSSGTFGAGTRPFRICGDPLPTNRPLSMSLMQSHKSFVRLVS